MSTSPGFKDFSSRVLPVIANEIHDLCGPSGGPSPIDAVNSIPPIQQNSMKIGYDESNNYNKSDETKCAPNYSFITNNNKWNVNTHNYMQLTKHDTYDDVDLDNCVEHTVR